VVKDGSNDQSRREAAGAHSVRLPCSTEDSQRPGPVPHYAGVRPLLNVEQIIERIEELRELVPNQADSDG
jgi:hypothetical protein